MFGVEVSVVDYVWEKYSGDCKIEQPRHLLLILHFLKAYPIENVLAVIFGMSVRTIEGILWKGIVNLAEYLDEVRSSTPPSFL